MNNETLLQLTKLLDVDGDDGAFGSAYKLNGLQILPPLMTEIKRLQMQQFRLDALTRELERKRSKPPLVDKELKSLMPLMVNASTNTVLPVQSPGPVSTSAPMVVMGRFRQKLQRSETAVYDYSDIRLTPLAPAKALPLLEATHMVFWDEPQRALVKITPIVLGTLKSSWISKLGLCRPLQRCTTSIELRELHCQERVPGRPVVFPSSTQIPKALPNTSQGRFRSQIPRIQRSTVVPKVQAPLAGVIAPGHASCYEPNAVKTDSANERRRHYGAKVAMKRNEMAKKREELAKLKPKPKTYDKPISIRTPIRRVEAGEYQESEQHLKHEEQQRSAMTNTNNQVPKVIKTPITCQEGSAKTNNNIQVIKSIRTPIRRVEAGSEDPDLQQQRNRVQSLPVSRQELEQQRLQIQELPSPSNNQVHKIIRTPIKRVEGAELLEPELLLQKNRPQSLISRQDHEQQQGSMKTNNNIQATKSIRTPIRRMEAGSEDPDLQQQRNRVQSLPVSRQDLEQRRLQIQELPYPSNKIIRTPIKRVEGAELLEPELLLQKNRSQSLISRQEHEQQQGSVKTNNNIQATNSIRTPIRRVEAGSEDPDLQQQRNRVQSLPVSRQDPEQRRLQIQELPYPSNKIIRTPIKRVEGADLLEPELLLQKNRSQSLISRQEHEQQQGSVKTNHQVPKSEKRVEGAELLEPELLQQKHRIQLLISRQELEQQRLQAQLEQQQQGLIDQMVGNIATVDSRDTTSELAADPEQQPVSVPDPHQA